MGVSCVSQPTRLGKTEYDLMKVAVDPCIAASKLLLRVIVFGSQGCL